MIVLESDRAKTRSTATASGAYSSSQASMPLSIVTSRCGDREVGRGAQHVDVDQAQRPADGALDHAQAAAGQAGVDPEHAHARLLPRRVSEQVFVSTLGGPAGAIGVRHADAASSTAAARHTFAVSFTSGSPVLPLSWRQCARNRPALTSSEDP